MIYYILILFLMSMASINNLKAVVDDITGDIGGAQSGSLNISGGSSGGVFDSSTSTITHSFNFLSLPITTSLVGQIIIGDEPVLHTMGGGAQQNIFVGAFSGNFEIEGAMNTGCGHASLLSLTTGSFNTSIGQATLVNLTDGIGNTAVGRGAGTNITSGNNNILIGPNAGDAYSSDESTNIIIGTNPGVQGESNTIRIGDGQTACYIHGIFDQAVAYDSALITLVDVNGKLGTSLSSPELLENVSNIGDDSSAIWQLNPISFRIKSDKTRTKQFGLNAREVMKTLPQLAVKNKNGSPVSVKYHELPVLLLNELKKMKKREEKFENQIKELTERVKDLEHLCRSKDC